MKLGITQAKVYEYFVQDCGKKVQHFVSILVHFVELIGSPIFI